HIGPILNLGRFGPVFGPGLLNWLTFGSAGRTFSLSVSLPPTVRGDLFERVQTTTNLSDAPESKRIGGFVKRSKLMGAPV
ncbi:hypothetical protein ACMD2_05913, partial [Ananas comosus]